MKREDFKEITEEHIKICKKIIKQKGKCIGIDCKECMFYKNNRVNDKGGCHQYSSSVVITVEDPKLVQSCKEFLKLSEEGIDFEFSEEDKIKSPNHYKLEGLNCETIDVVKARLGKEGFKAFCTGNIIKYILRAEKKNGLEDYKKSRQYLDWLIEECER